MRSNMGATAMAALLLMTAGCGDGPEGTGNATAPAKQAAKPAAKPTNVNQPVEEAMAAIPPSLRISFQDALQCEVKRKPGAVTIDAAFVRKLTSQLQRDPSIAKC